MSIEWGSVAEWVGAVSTAGAFAAAGLVYGQDRRNRSRELVESVLLRVLHLEVFQGSGQPRQHMLKVSAYNHSPLPLIDVSVYGPDPDKPGQYVQHRVLAPSNITDAEKPGADLIDHLVIHPANVARLEVVFVQKPDMEAFIVRIIDGRNRVWYKRLNSGREEISRRRFMREMSKWRKKKPSLT